MEGLQWLIIGIACFAGSVFAILGVFDGEWKEQAEVSDSPIAACLPRLVVVGLVATFIFLIILMWGASKYAML